MELTSRFVDFNTNLTRLIEKDVHNEPQIKDVLVSSKDEIIEMFGGLLNMIQLCLMNTNTHCIEKINKIKLKSFEKILNDNKVIITKESPQPQQSDSENISANVELQNKNTATDTHETDLVNSPKTPISLSVNSISSSNVNWNKGDIINNSWIQSNDDNKNNPNFDDAVQESNNNYNVKHYEKNIQVSSLGRYYGTKVILNCETTECLVFKLINYKPFISLCECLFKITTSQDRLNKAWEMYNFASNKYVMRVIPSLTVFCFVLAFTVAEISGNEEAGYILTSIGMFWLLICIPLVGMLINTKILYLVIHTFDFWYKLFNVIMFLTSSQILRAYTVDVEIKLWFICLQQFDFLLVFCLMFIIDAFSLSHKFKISIILVVSFFMIGDVIYDYFLAKDYVWNPFESYNLSLTQISFKSMNLTASSNLSLFILKPLLGKIMRKLIKFVCRSCYSDHQTQDNVGQSPKYHRLWSVYKRPYVSWQ